MMKTFLDPAKGEPADSDDSSYEFIPQVIDFNTNEDVQSASDQNNESDSSDADINEHISDDTTTDSSNEDGDGIDDVEPIKNGNNSEDSRMKNSEKDQDDDDDSDWESDSSEEAEATMEEIFGTKPNKEAEKNHPPNLKTDAPVLDICFHPEAEILAAGNICGECILYRYSLEKVEEIKKFTPHESSCRQICFNDNGSLIYTVSNDKSIAVIDVESASVQSRIENAHDAAIYSFFEIHKNLVATGDDDGTVKLWDLRKAESVMEYKCSEETVTSLISCESNKFLSATCADGSLTGINIKRKKMETQSEMFDSEFTCQSLVRADSRLAVGSGSGIFYIFNWGDFGYNIDALSGHPDGIACQASITDRIIITGCNDGLIRATNMYPHRFIGIVGQHKDFSVDNIAVSNDGLLLASCSNDDLIQFWNIEYLYNRKINPKKKSNKAMQVRKHLQSSRRQNPKDFFNDIPRKLESDDEGGPVPPVPGTSYDSD